MGKQKVGRCNSQIRIWKVKDSYGFYPLVKINLFSVIQIREYINSQKREFILLDNKLIEIEISHSSF